MELLQFARDGVVLRARARRERTWLPALFWHELELEVHRGRVRLNGAPADARLFEDLLQADGRLYRLERALTPEEDARLQSALLHPRPPVLGPPDSLLPYKTH